MKTKYLEAFMKTAETFAELSTAQRLHVGAIVVKDNRIISIGYNGMPSGWDNNCEEVVNVNPSDPRYDYDRFNKELKTKPEVLHAETNAIAKLARSTESGLDASLFVTHAPCLDCAKLIYQSGISSVYYRNSYRDTSGVEFLTKAAVWVKQI
jgi:dCMP deaminase